MIEIIVALKLTEIIVELKESIVELTEIIIWIENAGIGGSVHSKVSKLSKLTAFFDR